MLNSSSMILDIRVRLLVCDAEAWIPGIGRLWSSMHFGIHPRGEGALERFARRSAGRHREAKPGPLNRETSMFSMQVCVLCANRANNSAIPSLGLTELPKQRETNLHRAMENQKSPKCTEGNFRIEASKFRTHQFSQLTFSKSIFTVSQCECARKMLSIRLCEFFELSSFAYSSFFRGLLISI